MPPKILEEKRRAYSVREAARICGVSRATLYRLLKEGKINNHQNRLAPSRSRSLH
jgi:predicted DNA-binding transcriptional regulator AlpA